MNPLKFKCDNFSYLTTLAKYAGLLQTSEAVNENGKIVYYLNLENKEDIESFLSSMKEGISSLFIQIAAVAKGLYLGDKAELEECEQQSILELIVALSEIGSYINDGLCDMTPENTRPKF